MFQTKGKISQTLGKMYLEKKNHKFPSMEKNDSFFLFSVVCTCMMLGLLVLVPGVAALTGPLLSQETLVRDENF